MWDRADYVNQYVTYVVTWHVLVCALYDDDNVIYEDCSESKERLRIQPAQLFHCTKSVIWCVQ